MCSCNILGLHGWEHNNALFLGTLGHGTTIYYPTLIVGAPVMTNQCHSILWDQCIPCCSMGEFCFRLWWAHAPVSLSGNGKHTWRPPNGAIPGFAWTERGMSLQTWCLGVFPGQHTVHQWTNCLTIWDIMHVFVLVQIVLPRLDSARLDYGSRG